MARHGSSFLDNDGRTKMIRELNGDAEMFEQLDVVIREAMKPIRKKLGIEEEVLDEQVDKRLAEVKSGLALEE